jgi:hypothetical protein
MAISQADFYAFSQATGAPVPDDPEARARIAPQVMEWRRNQLKQPKEEGGIVDTLGKIALGAGALAAGIAGYRALRGRQAVSPVNVTVQEEVVRRAAQPIPRLRGVTQQVGAETARPPSPRPPAPVTPVVVRDITPPSAPPRGKTGPGVVDPWSGPAPTSYRGPLFESAVDTKNLLNQINSFVSAKGRYPETDLEFQQYLDYNQRLSRALPAAEEEFIAYRPDPKDPAFQTRFQVPSVSPAVQEARRSAAKTNLIEAARRTNPYQLELPGVRGTLMALRSPVSSFLEETGEKPLLGITKNVTTSISTSRPLEAAPAQTNLFQYVKQAAEPEGDVVDRLLTEYNQLVERQARTDQRVRSSVREYQMELQGKALRIMDELRGDSLTQQHQTKRPFNVDQAINALESGEDQTTGRMRQQLQRNEGNSLAAIDALEDQTNDINVAASLTPDGIPVDQAEGLTVLDLQKKEAFRIPPRALGQEKIEDSLAQRARQYLLSKEVDLDYDYESENLAQAAQVNQRIARALELKNTAERIIAEETGKPISSGSIRKIDVERARAVSEGERQKLAAQGLAGEALERQLLENMQGNFPQGRIAMAPLQQETRQIERAGMPSALSVVENIGSVEPIKQGEIERIGKPASQQPGYEGGIRGMGRITREDIEEEGGGMGVYGLEPKYASGAVRKRGEFGESEYGELGYEYSPAAQRRPTQTIAESKGEIALEDLPNPYSKLSDEQLGELTMYGSEEDRYNAQQQLQRRKSAEVSTRLRTLQLSNQPGAAENFLTRFKEGLI